MDPRERTVHLARPGRAARPAHRLTLLLRVLLGVALLGSVSASLAAGQTPAGNGSLVERTLSVDGRERSYRVYVPAGYDAAVAAPLVLVLHGGGGNGQMMTGAGFNAEADRDGFLVVYPDGGGGTAPNFSWNVGTAPNERADDVAFVVRLLDTLQAEYSVDARRVYATGISNGGRMAYRLACELSDRIAAVGAVAASMPFTSCTPTAPVAVIHLHGTLDDFIPYEGGAGPRSTSGRADNLPIPAVIEFWRDQNGCAPTAAVEAGEIVTREVYSACRGGTAVTLYTLDGGGHSWFGWPAPPALGHLGSPDGAVSATPTIWQFFQAHPKP